MMNHATDYDRLRKRYRFYAPRYDRIFKKYSAATLRKALEFIPLDEETWLLDVACGTGLLAEMLLRERPHLHFTGVDVSPDMLEQARRRVPPIKGRIEWLVGFAEDLPVQSSRYDVVTCTNAFHLVQDSEGALHDFRRVLRPGGSLVLVDWCLDFPIMRLRNAALSITDRQRRRIRNLDEMAALLEQSGFEIQEQERFTPRPLWGLMCLVARKPLTVPSETSRITPFLVRSNSAHP